MPNSFRFIILLCAMVAIFAAVLSGQSKSAVASPEVMDLGKQYVSLNRTIYDESGQPGEGLRMNKPQRLPKVQLRFFTREFSSCSIRITTMPGRSERA